MRTKYLLLIATATMMMLAGCATERGGTVDDEYNLNTGYDLSTNPQPTSSPTFRPDLNRQDIRNPNSLTQPQPNIAPPPTPP